jgi:hypothetical protein
MGMTRATHTTHVALAQDNRPCLNFQISLNLSIKLGQNQSKKVKAAFMSMSVVAIMRSSCLDVGLRRGFCQAHGRVPQSFKRSTHVTNTPLEKYAAF